MNNYPFPVESLRQHGCRLVADDDSYEDNDHELSVRLSPLVPIPDGQLLVGPTANRLMQLHALLMSSHVPQGGALTPADGLLLAKSLVEQFGYEGFHATMTEPGNPRTNAGDELLAQVEERYAQVSEAMLWKGLARALLAYGDDFAEKSTDGSLYLVRRSPPPVGVLDSKASQPLIWERQLSKRTDIVNAWTIPSATVQWMTEQLRSDFPALREAQPGAAEPALRERPRA